MVPRRCFLWLGASFPPCADSGTQTLGLCLSINWDWSFSYTSSQPEKSKEKALLLHRAVAHIPMARTRPWPHLDAEGEADVVSAWSVTLWHQYGKRNRNFDGQPVIFDLPLVKYGGMVHWLRLHLFEELITTAGKHHLKIPRQRSLAIIYELLFLLTKHVHIYYLI